MVPALTLSCAQARTNTRESPNISFQIAFCNAEPPLELKLVATTDSKFAQTLLVYQTPGNAQPSQKFDISNTFIPWEKALRLPTNGVLRAERDFDSDGCNDLELINWLGTGTGASYYEIWLFNRKTKSLSYSPELSRLPSPTIIQPGIISATSISMAGAEFNSTLYRYDGELHPLTKIEQTTQSNAKYSMSFTRKVYALKGSEKQLQCEIKFTDKNHIELKTGTQGACLTKEYPIQ